MQSDPRSLGGQNREGVRRERAREPNVGKGHGPVHHFDAMWK
jgi:hypothetical protein